MKRSNRSSTVELLIATCSSRFEVLTQRHEVVCEDHDTILTLSFARGNDQKVIFLRVEVRQSTTTMMRKRSMRRECGERLTDDLSLALHVIPEDETVQVTTCGEEDTSLRTPGKTMGESNILFGLRPTWDQKHIDRDLFP